MGIHVWAAHKKKYKNSNKNSYVPMPLAKVLNIVSVSTILLIRMNEMKLLQVTGFVIAVCALGSLVEPTTVYSNSIDHPLNQPVGFSRTPDFANSLRRRCPRCDSSVESYCSEKLFHDSCCCTDPYNPYDRLPLQCRYADCSFLHAENCQAHHLITACCCTKALLYRK